jgi:hypothetical protein
MAGSSCEDDGFSWYDIDYAIRIAPVQLSSPGYREVGHRRFIRTLKVPGDQLGG